LQQWFRQLIRLRFSKEICEDIKKQMKLKIKSEKLQEKSEIFSVHDSEVKE